jgi:hypothetical protein
VSVEGRGRSGGAMESPPFASRSSDLNISNISELKKKKKARMGAPFEFGGRSGLRVLP